LGVFKVEEEGEKGERNWHHKVWKGEGGGKGVRDLLQAHSCQLAKGRRGQS